MQKNQLFTLLRILSRREKSCRAHSWKPIKVWRPEIKFANGLLVNSDLLQTAATNKEIWTNVDCIRVESTNEWRKEKNREVKRKDGKGKKRRKKGENEGGIRGREGGAKELGNTVLVGTVIYIWFQIWLHDYHSNIVSYCLNEVKVVAI